MRKAVIETSLARFGIHLIESRVSEVQLGFIEQKPLDGEEYLASLGMTNLGALDTDQ